MCQCLSNRQLDGFLGSGEVCRIICGVRRSFRLASSSRCVFPSLVKCADRVRELQPLCVLFCRQPLSVPQPPLLVEHRPQLERQVCLSTLESQIWSQCTQDLRGVRAPNIPLATCAGLAVIFEISQSGMWMAVHGGTWNHLPNAVPYSGPWRGGGVRLKRWRLRRCLVCEDEFRCARSDARYCSGACRSLMHYSKVREWPNGHR